MVVVNVKIIGFLDHKMAKQSKSDALRRAKKTWFGLALPEEKSIIWKQKFTDE